MRRLHALLVPFGLAAVVLAGCGDEGASAAANPVTAVTEVVAEDNRFSPAAIEIPAGTTVTWKFKDRFIPHDVTADAWSSGDPQRSGSYTHTFAGPGTYPYRCTLHDGMTGKVVVTAT